MIMLSAELLLGISLDQGPSVKVKYEKSEKV